MMRLWRTALVSAALVMLLTGVGQARSFEIENALNGFKGVWRPMVVSGGFGFTRCNVLLEGEFLRWTNLKLPGLKYGSVLIATVESCAQGGMTIATESLPWSVLYSSFNGTLPNITAVNLTIVGMTLEAIEPLFGLTCRLTTSAASPATLRANREAGASITTYAIGGTIPTNCGISATLSGTGTANIQRSTTTRTRIYLI